MSPLQRVVTAAMEAAGRRMWGFAPGLMAPMIRQLGPLRALRWFGWNMPRYLSTVRAFGGLRTHLIGAAISMINGCPYCTYGEAYAFQLIHLKQRRQVFPLDEDAMAQLCGLSPAVIRRHLTDALQQVGLHAEVPVLDRAIELTLGSDRRPTEPDDIRLARLVRVMTMMNSVGMANGLRKAPGRAHDPINKDGALKLSYAGLRRAALS